MRGKRIAILEARLGEQLAELVAARGAVPVHAPALAAIGELPLEASRVIVQRYGVANAELDQALAARGAEVVEIPTYRWSLPADTKPLADLISALERGEIDATVFTNGEQARNLFLVSRQVNKEQALRAALNATLVASIGPV